MPEDLNTLTFGVKGEVYETPELPKEMDINPESATEEVKSFEPTTSETVTTLMH